jgi:hypothetical protein
LKYKLVSSRFYKKTLSSRSREFIERVLRSDEIKLNEVMIKRPKIHHSVFDRIEHSGITYAPINLPAHYVYVDNSGNLTEIGQSTPGGILLPESEEQAEIRKSRQSLVWNKVLVRKILYILTLVTVVGFVLYPFIAQPGGYDPEARLANTLGPWLGTFNIVIQQIPVLIGKIPGLGFAETWALKYQAFPFVFFFGALIILALLRLSTYLNKQIQNAMFTNWEHLHKTKQQESVTANRLDRGLAEILSREFNAWVTWTMPRLALESVFVVLFLALVVALFSRAFFLVYDASGMVCGETSDVQGSALGKPFTFNPTNTCFNTGLVLQAGKTYEIELEVMKWKDKYIPADIKGWCEDWCPGKSAPWYLNLAIPVRRHLLLDWYQPVARVGSTLLGRYPLTLKKPDPEEEQKVLSFELKAHRSGSLYLYVNDAVLFTPDLVSEFYSNNQGSAEVVVTEK